MKPFFNKETTNIIKGIALIMMFFHHFFMFPAWWKQGISYPLLEKLVPYLRDPSRLCVPVFCFLTGYLYYFGKEKTYRYSLRKITDILIPYWAVFLLFAVIAAIDGYQFTLPGVLLEMTGLHSPIMMHCWYVCFYMVVMLLLPALTRLMSKNVHLDIVLSAVVVPVLLRRLHNAVCNGSPIIGDLLWNCVLLCPVVLIGFVFARYGLFGKIDRLICKLFPRRTVRTIVLCLLFLIVPLGRYYPAELSLSFGTLPVLHKTLAFSVNLDIVYAPLFVYAIAGLCEATKAGILKGILGRLGKYSLLMWFLSCIFHNPTGHIFQPVLYFPRNPILVLAWGLLLCCAVAFVLDLGLRRIIDWKNRLLFPDRETKSA